MSGGLFLNIATNCNSIKNVKLKIMEKSKQIGCGYCYIEKQCKKRERHINKAKQGCKEYKHFKDVDV